MNANKRQCAECKDSRLFAFISGLSFLAMLLVPLCYAWPGLLVVMVAGLFGVQMVLILGAIPRSAFRAPRSQWRVRVTGSMLSICLL